MLGLCWVLSGLVWCGKNLRRVAECFGLLWFGSGLLRCGFKIFSKVCSAVVRFGKLWKGMVKFFFLHY